MITHDPRKVLETLRNHLTQPEANIAFLFGAGTSCAVQVPITEDAAPEGGYPKDAEPKTRSLIPNVAELTAICAKEIRTLDPEGEQPRFGPAYDLMDAEVKPKNRPTNIEDILSCVRRKLHAIGAEDRLAGLSKPDLELVEKTIQRTIAERVNPARSHFPEHLPHEAFVRWLARMPRTHPVEIFTTNYDVLIETALEAERIAAFDGFVGCNRPFFCHESLIRPEHAPGPSWARLWKMHGSINWRREVLRGRSRIIRTEPHDEGEMIFPSHHKYDESRRQPYTALLDRFSRVLERDDTILFVCGYSFSDDHINAIIFDALEAKQRPHVIALQFLEIEEGSILAERASRHLNLMALGPSFAHLGGKRGAWRVEGVHSAAPILQAFQMDEPEGDDPHTGTGKLLLGDFAKFTDFLGALTGAK